MRIGELVARTGLAASAIRFYEAQGVLPRPARGTNGYRDYSESAVERLRLVRLGQQVGFSLGVIRGLFGETGECAHSKTLAEVVVRLREIESLQTSLAEQHRELVAVQVMLIRTIAASELPPSGDLAAAKPIPLERPHRRARA